METDGLPRIPALRFNVNRGKTVSSSEVVTVFVTNCGGSRPSNKHPFLQLVQSPGDCIHRRRDIQEIM